MSDKVIELSIKETNDLRCKLGLKPLQLDKNESIVNNDYTGSSQTNFSDRIVSNTKDENLNPSVEETNVLRASLGLTPLRSSSENEPTGRKSSEAIHAPPLNTGQQDQVRKRIETARLKREVDAGILKMKKDNSIAHDDNYNDKINDDTLAWADKMRAGVNVATKEKEIDDSSKVGKRKKYTEKDVINQNISVKNAASDFELGTTTILTLADKSLLDGDKDGGEQLLENVSLTENQIVKDNLKKKRAVEMGQGHAGGYVGYDDDEFEELGGSQKTVGALGTKGDRLSNQKRNGFKLSDIHDKLNQSNNRESNLFATETGQAISLVQSTYENSGKHQSDFMTFEEQQQEFAEDLIKEKKKQKKREKKMFKKIKKRKKHERKHGKNTDNDEEFNGEGKNDAETSKTNSLLDDLEASAPILGKHNARNESGAVVYRRYQDEDDSDEDNTVISRKKPKTEIRNKEELPKDANLDTDNEKPVNKEVELLQQRKLKFNEIMEKGNVRSDAVFKQGDSLQKKRGVINNEKDSASRYTQKDGVEEEDDDAFLALALAKARRLNRLRELNAKSTASKGKDPKENNLVTGVDAVVHSLKEQSENNINKSNGSKGGVTFELDATKEFSRALRARVPQNKRPILSSRNAVSIKVSTSDTKKINKYNSQTDNEEQPVDSKKIEDENDTMDNLEKLADQIDENSNDISGFGSTASTNSVGRGLANVLSMLKHTGEITGKNAGKEELRGRAKDKRTYEDYEALNLKEVVKIDRVGLTEAPNKKDLEFANREIKLEYRDDHGRLLTRKEAYRNLCYQFHGYGSSQKNEERRLRQIEKERVEPGIGSAGKDSTLGALKVTQKATGKAFVVHKTG